MDARHIRTFRIGMMALCLVTQTAMADPAAEMERANEMYSKEQMMDAAVIFRQLALQNYPPAQARLGEMLDYTEEDEEAVGWYIMSAAQGDAVGAHGLGKMYFTGEGIKKDPEQALYWYRFAAEKDNLNAIKVIVTAYRLGPASGLPVSADLKQAEFWNAKKIPLEKEEMKQIEEKKLARLRAVYKKQEALKKEIEEAAKAAK